MFRAFTLEKSHARVPPVPVGQLSVQADSWSVVLNGDRFWRLSRCPAVPLMR